MNYGTTLFVLAHPDDELYVYGLIQKILKQGNTVVLFFGYIQNDNYMSYDIRAKICQQYWENKISYFIGEVPPLTGEIQTWYLKDKLEAICEQYIFDTVITHGFDDRHQDHKTLSRVCELVFRPDRTDVKNLIHFYIPGNNQNLSDYNFISNISFDDMQSRIELFDLYGPYLNGANKELYKYNEFIGSLFGIQYAEAYKLIYRKDIHEY